MNIKTVHSYLVFENQKEYVALPEEFSCQVDFQGMVHKTVDPCTIIGSFERRNIQFAITSTSLYDEQVY